MSINSKQKGKRGELEFASFLKDRGIAAHRSAQYCGKNGDADVVTDLDNLHFEVKRTETFSPYKALEQATQDCRNKVAVVAHKKNRSEWHVFISADDFINLIRGLSSAKQPSNG